MANGVDTIKASKSGRTTFNNVVCVSSSERVGKPTQVVRRTSVVFASLFSVVVKMVGDAVASRIEPQVKSNSSVADDSSLHFPTSWKYCRLHLHDCGQHECRKYVFTERDT